MFWEVSGFMESRGVRGLFRLFVFLVKFRFILVLSLFGCVVSGERFVFVVKWFYL